MIYEIAINQCLLNKPDKRSLRFNQNKFTTYKCTVDELIEIITSGHSVCSSVYNTQNGRNSESFIKSQIILLDFDEGITLEEISNNDFIKNNASFIYTSFNHQKTKVTNKGNIACDRFRVVFILESPINDKEKYLDLLNPIYAKFPMVDKACKDSIRIFYGNKEAKIIRFNKILSDESINNLIENYKSQNKSDLNKEVPSKKRDDLDSLEYKKLLIKISEALSFIPGDEAPYPIWRNCNWAVRSVLNLEDAIKVIKDWSPDFKGKEGHIEELMKRANGSIGIGTLFYYAHKYSNGAFKNEGMTVFKPGQVAYFEIFTKTRYINYLNQVYYYCQKDKYFKSISDDSLQSRITKYFDTYVTGYKSKQKDYGYASFRHVKDAFQWFKSKIFFGDK